MLKLWIAMVAFSNRNFQLTERFYHIRLLLLLDLNAMKWKTELCFLKDWTTENYPEIVKFMSFILKYNMQSDKFPLLVVFLNAYHS